MGDRYYNLCSDTLFSSGYYEKISPALEEISFQLNKNNVGQKDIVNYFYSIHEMYLAEMINETVIPVDFALLKYLTKRINFLDLFIVPLEEIPKECSKHKIVTQTKQESKPNHQGIFYNNKFFYYHLLFFCKIDAHESPLLVQQHLFLLVPRKVTLSRFHKDTN